MLNKTKTVFFIMFFFIALHQFYEFFAQNIFRVFRG